MNAEITQLRTALNEAIYDMIDASSDKRFNTASDQVRWLRRNLHVALREWLHPRTCFYCTATLDINDNKYCPDCQADEDTASAEVSWCEDCGKETENNGDDYCEACWFAEDETA